MEAVKNLTKYSLLKEINAIESMSKSHKEKINKMIGDDHTLFQSLLEIAFEYNNENSEKACTILEDSCEKNPDLIAFHLNYFTDSLLSITNESAVRSIAKVCHIISENYNSKFDSPIKLIITENQLSNIIEASFDWLLKDQKVSTKADAMETLYFIGLKSPWIHYELKMILEKNLEGESPAYISRAKKILDLIGKNKAA